MSQRRQRVLRPAEIPVGMSGPGDVEVLAEIDRELDPLVGELVEDQSVVDAQYARHLCVTVVPELPPAFFDPGRVYRPHAPELLGEGEVHEGLLRRRVKIEQDDVFRRKAAEDGVADLAAITLRVEAREEEIERRPFRAEVAQGQRLKELEGVEGGKSLELDQFRRQFAAGVARDGEVRDGEDRVRVRSGDVE